ncbi:hypothetical protein [Pseudonocardia sp. TRM90224]|uniref:hypothetical protein n=1 Tax=Pseudonocardia sp. TRM90224 TaxID=2812678 RepID=UPI001E28B4DF|nr:hypothetical protein [Pseudonocardia sp. TRM90224]
MKRLFWMGLGVAIGAYVTKRATEAAHNLTPAGMGANLADGLRELGSGIGAFGAEIRAGMETREQELTELVERRTGAALPTYRDALAEEPAPRARARRAGA